MTLEQHPATWPTEVGTGRGRSHGTSGTEAFDRWFRYPAGFASDYVATLLDHINLRAGTVIDCFAGSGVTGTAARKRGLSSVGIEAHPMVGDRVKVPGEGLRLQRTVMSSRDKGVLIEDTLKNNRSRTVPLVDDLVQIIDTWAAGTSVSDWLFQSPKGGPLASRTGSGRSAGRPRFGRSADRPCGFTTPRHTCASLWLGAGADPKVVLRILGHASAAMTMDLDGHLIDHSLWASAKRVRGILGASEPDSEPADEVGRNGEWL